VALHHIIRASEFKFALVNLNVTIYRWMIVGKFCHIYLQLVDHFTPNYNNKFNSIAPALLSADVIKVFEPLVA